MQPHESVLHSFLWVNNVPLHGLATCYLSIDQLMGIWFVSEFWLLGTCCFEHLCTSFCVDVCFQFSWWVPSRESAGLKGDSELSGIGHLFKEKDLVQDPENLLNNR